ncbi:MAG: hypothetical protein KGJ07_06570 [Patescibacteria group bacterium]|nr:hypothetical protein [Patescibacteria group bacterium]MDE2588964.1 hypothetical protein [Patescibacteria group bacterium]
MALHEFPRHAQFSYAPPPRRPGTIEQIREDKVSEGMAILLTRCSQMEPKTPDVVVFLNKSGRQLSRLFLTLWREKFPDTPMPEIKSINIGREASEEAAQEKVAHVLEEARTEGTLTHTFAKHVRGKHVLVVDDIIHSQSTQNQVAQIFSSNAFAPASFDSIAILTSPLLAEDSAALGVVEATYPDEFVTLPFTLSYATYLRKQYLDRQIPIEREQLAKAVQQHSRRLEARDNLRQLEEEREALAKRIGIFPDVMLHRQNILSDRTQIAEEQRQLRRDWDDTARRMAPYINPTT